MCVTCADHTARDYECADGPYSTDKSAVTLTDCVVQGNRAGLGGAGIYMVSGSSLTLKNVNVTENEADTWGGGVFAWESVVTVDGRVKHILSASHPTHCEPSVLEFLELLGANAVLGLLSTIISAIHSMEFRGNMSPWH